MSRQQRIARNTLLAIVGVAGAGVVRFVFTVAVGREFGATLLGDIAVILAVAAIATIPAAGIGAAANRYLAVASGAHDTAMRTNTLGATWRGAMIVIAGAVAASWAFLDLQGATELDATSLVIGLVFVAAYGLYITSKGILFGDGHAAPYAIGEVIGVLAFSVTLVLVLSTSASVGWMISSQVAWALGVTAVAVAVGVGPTRFRGRAPDGLWPFAATATVGSLVSLGVIHATVLVMAAMHGSREAGLLAAGLAITAPLYLLPRALSLALTPSMSSHLGAGSRERANLDAEYTTTALILFGGVATASVIALADVILALYGSDFADAGIYIALLAIASFVTIAGIPVVNRFASEGQRPLQVTVAASAVGAAGAGAVWFTIGREDPTWIAVGFLVAAVTKVVIPFAMSKRVVGASIVPPAILTVFVCSGVAAALVGGFWGIGYVVAVALGSIPLLFVATVRYRADAAHLAPERANLVVGVLTNMYPHEGNPYSGTFVRNRVEAYRELGAEVVVVSPRRASGILKYLLLSFDALVALLQQPIPDVFEVHPTQPTGVIATIIARIARRPYVLYAHGSDVAIMARSSVHRRLVDWAVDNAAEIHTNSEYMADQIAARWMPKRPARVLPPGVVVPASIEPASTRDIDVLFVGSLTGAKGIDTLLDAVSGMGDKGDLNIVIIGEGPERERLTDLASRHRLDAHFLGALPPVEVHAMMARSRTLVLPSTREALGQAAIEALAHGTPIVVSDVGGLASVPTPACGSTVPPGDPEAIAAELRRWLDMTTSEWEQASLAAHLRAEDFDLRVVAQRALDRFQAVAEQSRSTAPV